jgi:hypothetical protein
MSQVSLKLPLPRANQKQRLMTTRDGEVLRERFSGKLLRYRFEQHVNVANHPSGMMTMSPELWFPNQSLTAALAAAPLALKASTHAFKEIDERAKSDRSSSELAVVTEALLMVCHEMKTNVKVGGLTAVVNVIRRGRGASELSARMVGQYLRDEFGISPRRTSTGFEIEIDDDFERTVHTLADELGTLSMLTPRVECFYCRQLQGHEHVANLKIEGNSAGSGSDE